MFTSVSWKAECNQKNKKQKTKKIAFKIFFFIWGVLLLVAVLLLQENLEDFYTLWWDETAGGTPYWNNSWEWSCNVSGEMILASTQASNLCLSAISDLPSN